MNNNKEEHKEFVWTDELVLQFLRHTIMDGNLKNMLAQNSPLGKSAESYLRLINARYPSGEPQAGQRIKIIE